MKQSAQILGYNEGQILEPFKNAFPTNYCYVFFGIQHLKDTVDNVKHVMTKEKLDKQLESKSSTPYMSLKTNPSTKIKIVKFNEYKLLNNQIDKLTG